jgi:small subunit ribosomal protein S2
LENNTENDLGLELQDLIDAGVQFGHQTRRWNPKMKRFIFSKRNGIHIIDLRKTLDRLAVAREAVRRTVMSGEKILFVCTKKSLKSVVEQEARSCGSFFITERWLGGMLTNFQTIRKQIRRLKELERGQEESAFEFYTKKERLLLDRERTKLDKYLSGVKDMSRLPGALFVVDARREITAIREANTLGIPVIGVIDTNADPELIDYPIPGNDDAIRSVGLIAHSIADVIQKTNVLVPEAQKRQVQESQATTYSTETGEVKEEQSRSATKAASPSRRKVIQRPTKIAKEINEVTSSDEENINSEGVEALDSKEEAETSSED